MNIKGRQIDACASKAILNGIKFFVKEFPEGTDKDFEFFFACLFKQVGTEIYKWEQEKFSKTS